MTKVIKAMVRTVCPGAMADVWSFCLGNIWKFYLVMRL